jgi:ribonuclease P protein component
LNAPGAGKRKSHRGIASRYGFGRHLRLLKPQAFSEVFSARRAHRGSIFALHWKENGLGFPRLGVVIAKKHARSAVLRNALKRQAREAFRLRRAKLPALDLALRLTRPVAVVEKKRWRAEIEALFERIGEPDASASRDEGAA